MKSEAPSKPLLALLLPLLVFILAILATVMFANERRNLKRLLAVYDIADPFGTFDEPLTVQSEVQKSQKTGKLSILTSTNEVSGVSNFSLKSAQDICKFLEDGGFKVDPWKRSRMDEALSECSAEKAYGELAIGLPPRASVYILIRGKESGETSSLRMKLVAPIDDDGKAAYFAFKKSFNQIADFAGWTELDDIKRAIVTLADKVIDKVDISASFIREKTNLDAYNLIVRPNPTSPRKFVVAPKSK